MFRFPSNGMAHVNARSSEWRKNSHNVSIPFKQESAWQLQCHSIQKPKKPCFDSLQTGECLATTADPVSTVRRVMFPFPSNGNAQTKSCSSPHNLTGERLVSIPFKRESLYKAETWLHVGRWIFNVSIPFKRESLYKVDARLVVLQRRD